MSNARRPSPGIDAIAATTNFEESPSSHLVVPINLACPLSSYMGASFQGRRAEEAGALAHELASLAFRHVFILPIRNALDRKASQSRVEQAQLMVINRRPNSRPRESSSGLAKLS